MSTLREMLGTEQAFDHLHRALRHHVERQNPPVVGAVHVTCSDESEHEALEAFQHGFVDAMLPDFKLWNKAPFRCANLGARYEWGAVRIAEQHYAAKAAHGHFKTVVVKINAHVAVAQEGGERRFGHLIRYENESVACGALHALLDGQRHPFTNDLHDALISDGRDLVDTLRDTQAVAPAYRSLFAAIASARVQARRAILDIQDYQPTGPTYYVVLPSVTLNLAGRDTEVPVGVYDADFRQDEPRVEYHGLGDNPARYALEYRFDQLVVQDDEIRAPRAARNHRQHLMSLWRERHAEKTPVETLCRDERFAKFLDETGQKKHCDRRYAKAMLKGLLLLLADLDPVSAAVTLFAQGIASVYHAHRVHRIVHDLTQTESARRVLADIHDEVESLPPEQAAEVIELLLDYYRQ